METIKSILRKIDLFGVPFSFKYQSEEKFTTVFGGLVVTFFSLFSLMMGIYYFIPFYNRKNFTTVYYTLSTSQAERVSFSNSKSTVSLGLNCWTGSDGTTADELFKLDLKYFFWYYQDGEYKRNITTLKSHFCTKDDFYNQFDETFEASQIYKYQCLDDPTITIEGIWTSEIFSYFQFEVNAKNKSKAFLKRINDYLIENDCKLQIYYSDHTIDINDYKNPIKSYVEAMFIQINPTLSIRRNLFFMNQYLFDDDDLFWVFIENEEEPRDQKTLFSRYEEYSLFQGLERQKNSTDYLNFVKLYIRADTKKTEVKRTYQKISEFFADSFSLLLTMYEVLNFLFDYLNGFWAEQMLCKKLFFFQNFTEKLNIRNKEGKIRELLYITEVAKNEFKTASKIQADDKSEKPLSTMQSFHKEKILYQEKNRKKTSKFLNNIYALNDVSKEDIVSNYDKISNSFRGKEYNLPSKNELENNTLKKVVKNNDYNDSNVFTDNNINVVNTTNSNKDNETTSDEKIHEKVEYHYHLYDKIMSTLFKWCIPKKLKLKNELNEKAQSFLDRKLDIVLYVRNMILLDIFTEILLDPETKEVANFLTRPIISLKSDELDELTLLYNKYEENDFDKFYKQLIQLSNKPDKRKDEIKLITICYKHLKEMNM